MARFQAQTSAVLEDELEDLRQHLGFRTNQKADLLHELTTLAAWVVRQAAEGRSIVARGDDGTSELDHPAVVRLRRVHEQHGLPGTRIALSDDEAARLADMLDGGFRPPAALRDSLRRIADPERRPPTLSWPDAGA